MRDARVDLTLASSGGRTPFLTYEPYYGLKEKPFSLSSDPRFLYKSRAHAAVYDDLRAGIRRDRPEASDEAVERIVVDRLRRAREHEETV